jgi:hypothetical protein
MAGTGRVTAGGERRRGGWSVALRRSGAALLAWGCGLACSGEADDRQACRLIASWDQQSMWCLQLSYAHRTPPSTAEQVKARLEAVVDEHARAGVDRIVHCVFALPEGTVPPGMTSFPRRTWTGNFTGEDTAVVTMEEAGHDLIQVLLDRSRRGGMEFLACLRMNDRHGDPWQSSFGLAHPEWRLREGNLRGFDYRHDGVRQTVLNVADEVLARYDVDGLELDWMRHCHVFNPSEAPQHAGLLTELLQELRRRLDASAARRGRPRLLLGVRVPQTIAECRALGLDFAAWAQDGSIDYVCPSDFFYNDPNARVEDYVAALRGTPCKLYPSVHPKIAEGHLHQVPSAADYRGLAKNFLSYGADGISVYNYHYHWRADMGSEAEWPGVMRYLTDLRELASVCRGDRRYLFYPLWPSGKCPTGAQFDKTQTIVLGPDRAEGALRLRTAEDLADGSLEAQLQFKVTGLEPADELQLWLNGEAVPVDRLRRTPVPEGRLADAGRPLPAYVLCETPLSASRWKWGDNEVALRWTPAALPATDRSELQAQEWEAVVRTRPGAAAEEAP